MRVDRNVAEAIQKVANAGPCAIVVVVGGASVLQGTSAFFGNVPPQEMGAILGLATNYLLATVRLCREGLAPSDEPCFMEEFKRALNAPRGDATGQIVRRDTPPQGCQPGTERG
jgi:hypothetical protein